MGLVHKLISKVAIKEHFQDHARKIFYEVYHLDKVALDIEHADSRNAGLHSSDKELKENCR